MIEAAVRARRLRESARHAGRREHLRMEALDRELALHAGHADDLGAIDLATRATPEGLHEVIAA